MHSIINAEVAKIFGFGSRCRGFPPAQFRHEWTGTDKISICSRKVRCLAKQNIFQVHFKIYPLKHDLLLWPGRRLSSAIKNGCFNYIERLFSVKSYTTLKQQQENCKQTMMNIYERSWRAGKIDKQEKSEKNLLFGLCRLQRDAITGKVIWKKVSNYCHARSKSITRENCCWRLNFGRSKVMRRENCLNHKWTLAVNHCTSNTSF